MILVFDDRRSIRNFIQDEFGSDAEKLHFCSNIDDADEFIDENKGNIEGIILDIMIPTLGLSEEHRILTKLGVLTGWVWLWHHCNPEGIKPHPFRDIPIIIYSAYLDDYNLYIESNQPSEDEKEFAQRIKHISKDEVDDDDVIAMMREYFSL